jgi:hypothetical protein
MFSVHIDTRERPYDIEFKVGTKVAHITDHIRELCGMLVGGIIVDENGHEVDTETIEKEGGKYTFDHDQINTGSS